ncbi:MAG: tetratricopeptide repeat protein [Acidobacteriaceae bacterium]|nr:tetratricopeptide repeat protein [Acidobacteriaceae bacterium]
MQTPTDQQSLDLVREAALSGVHQAQVMFGQILLDGKLLERNPTWALHWFERAAKSGNIMAMNMVGRCLDQGWGAPQSPTMAYPWFRRAAEAGLDWGMYNLATALILGRGVKEDKTAGYIWLQKAAELNHAKSITLLAGFYEDGWVVEQNTRKAIELYKKSAELGDFRGQFNYARCLALAGEYDAAVEWLRLVPQTSTPAFLAKAREFFLSAPGESMRSLAQVLTAQ